MSRLNITAYDFAKPILGASDPALAVRLGVSPERAAAQLRRIADALEKGDLLLRNVEVATTAQQEDFTETRLVLKYVERDEPLEWPPQAWPDTKV